MSGLVIGQMGEFSKTISESDVYLYAGITGDFNSLHINAIKAEQSHFKQRIVHGMLIGGLISNVLGTKMPGEGTIYLEQNLKFLKPVYIGDTVTVRATVSEIINCEKGIYKINTDVYNQNDTLTNTGYAVVMYR